MSFDDQVRTTLAERAATVSGDPDLATTIIEQARTSRRRSWLVRGLVSVLSILVVIVLIATNVFGRDRVTGPDPRATGRPAQTTPVPTGLSTNATTTSSGITTPYRVVDGPAPTSAGTGSPISLLPRVERRGSTTWFAAPGVSVALPSSVNGARMVLPAVAGWIIYTVSAAFTGGDTDAEAQILAVSSAGGVRSLVTGAVRSVAVSPDGNQVASVETTERPWTVRLVVRQISDGAEVRRVTLPYGQPGEWPYSALLWTSAGILASNQSGAVSVPGASVLVKQDAVTDLPPVTGIFQKPGDTETFATVVDAGRECIGAIAIPSSDPLVLTCGAFGAVTPLGKGRLLISLFASDGKDAFLLDVDQATVTRLTLPDEVANAFLAVYPETDATVLVTNLTSNGWLRWNVVTNTVERAALPAGASSVITW